MTGRSRGAADALHLSRAQRFQQGQRAPGVGPGVQRQRLGVRRIAIAVGAARVLLLQVARVEQQHLGQVAGGRRGIDRSATAVLDQHRQPAAVVQVGVAEHHRVGLQQRRWRRGPVALAMHLEALEHAAVEQEARAADVDPVARAGDAVDGAVELDVHRTRLAEIADAGRPPHIDERAAAPSRRTQSGWRGARLASLLALTRRVSNCMNC